MAEPNFLGRALLGMRDDETLDEWRRRQVTGEASSNMKKYMRYLGVNVVKESTQGTRALMEGKWKRVRPLKEWLAGRE